MWKIPKVQVSKVEIFGFELMTYNNKSQADCELMTYDNKNQIVCEFQKCKFQKCKFSSL